MKRTLVASLLVSGLFTAFSNQAYAASCSPNDLVGDYAFETSGWNVMEGFPISIVGTVELDGVGKKAKIISAIQTQYGQRLAISGKGNLKIYGDKCRAYSKIKLVTGEVIYIDIAIAGATNMVQTSNPMDGISTSGTMVRIEL